MRLKKLSFATLLALFGSNAMAASNAVPIGANLGYGDASNKNTIFSASANPAWTGASIDQENNYGFALSGGVKVQQNEFNTLVNQYNTNIKPLLETTTTNSIAKADELQKTFTGLILDTRDNFYFQADASGALPIQITNKDLGGLTFEVSGYSSGRAKLLSSNKPIDIDSSQLNANSTNQDIINAATVQSAFYLKTAMYTELSATYANQFYADENGRFSVGLRAKYMQAKLVKSVNSLKKYLEASINNQDIGNQLNDDFKTHTDVSDTSNQIGVDLGAQWITENWMAGLTLMNLNSPKFDYNSLSSNAEAYSYRDQINLSESVELKPQARIEAALFSQNRNWTLGASADLNSTNDLINNEYQWATISASYASSSNEAWWYALVPDVRIGYRTNLVGDARSYITPGFTWGPLNLDMGFESFEDLSKLSNMGSTTEDNVDLPESLMINLGLEFYF